MMVTCRWLLRLFVGVLSGTWYVLWLIIARQNMSQHPCISHDEKLHIQSSLPLSDDVTLPVYTHLLTYLIT